MRLLLKEPGLIRGNLVEMRRACGKKSCLALAFITTYLFYERNLKAQARRHLTRLAVAARMADDHTLLAGACAWLLPEPGG